MIYIGEAQKSHVSAWFILKNTLQSKNVSHRIAIKRRPGIFLISIFYTLQKRSIDTNEKKLVFAINETTVL